MVSELLKSKLLVPPVRADLVQRPQLFSLLDGGLTKKLVLVSAPAGYGKTTLLSAWVRQSGLPAAWLSLDDADNDPAHFIRYIDASLHAAGIIPEESPLVPAQALDLIGAGTPGSLEDYPVALVNRLHGASGDFIAVLDDYHVITARPVHQFIAFLLDHLPPQMHLVIASRADPPLPLPRLRARSQLVEIRLTQLRFSNDEAADFIRRSGGVRLAAPQVAALAERTEGWAAGLQMAALSMQGQPDLDQYIHDFTGSNRFILDYLVDEVLEHQPEEVQQFLLQTSILDRLTASLCAALFESRESRIESRYQDQASPDDSRFSTLDSRSTLERLERENLFLLPLDDRRKWYRYHRLFADLLRKRLQQAYPDQISVLHSLASDWFMQNGLLPEAIGHALAAGDSDRAAALIEQGAEAVLMGGEVATLLGWLQQLPIELVRSRPRLDLYHLTCAVLIGEPQNTIEAGLERLSQHPELSHETNTLRAYLAAYLAQVSTAEELSRQALNGLPEQATVFRSLATWVHNAYRVSESGLDQRVVILEDQIRKSQATGNRMVWVSSLCSLAEVRVRQGNLPLARDLYQQAIQASSDPQGRLLPVAGEALIGLGHLLREWNEVDTAVRYIEQGIELVQQVHQFGMLEGLVALAMCRQVQGDDAGMRQALAQARQVTRSFDTTDVDDRMLDFYEALVFQKDGDSQAMPRYFEAKASNTSPNIDRTDLARIQARMEKYEQVAWARTRIHQKKPLEALATLDQLLPEMIREDRIALVIEIEVLRSQAMQALGSRRDAQITFEQALSAAAPGRFVRLFVDEGQAIVPLLQQAVERGVCAEYARRLLVAFEGGKAATSPTPSGQQADLSEPLSPRELEVLRLLSTSLSAKEIAAQLSVAESTVNSHVKTIYGKLGVHRRMEAVQRAEELQLIER